MKNGLYLSVKKHSTNQFKSVCDDNKIFWEGRAIKNGGLEVHLKSSAYDTLMKNGVDVMFATKVANTIRGEVHTIINDDATLWKQNGFSVGQKVRRCKHGWELV